MPEKIIFDTDPGIDDALALAYAVNSPLVDLLAVTTVFGNVHVDLATANALRILEITGSSHTPVAKGCCKPLIQALRPPTDFVHGKDGLGEIDLPAAKQEPLALTAVELLLEYSRKYEGELTVVAVGPLTNIAHALQLDSLFAKRLKKLVIMGGAALCNGNVSPVAEANIRSDPHAADLVFRSVFPSFAMVGLDVTEKVMMHDSTLALLRQYCGKTGQFIWDCSRFYMDFFKRSRSIDGCYVHDASALLYLLHPELFYTEKAAIRVTCEGNGAGNTLCDFGKTPHPDPLWKNTGRVDVCLGVQGEKVIAAYLKAFL